MRQRKAVNWLLLANLVLLIALTMTLVVGPGTLTPIAEAQQPRGIPDAGAQRLEIVRELRKLNAQIEEMRREMEKRAFAVDVRTMPPVRLAEER